MEHKIVISGEGSAHPKLGVKKKNSVEENLKILNDMIESGKLSLDHAIAKTKSNGTLRGIFKCSEDEEMAAHVDALYDFVVAYKKRLVPDFDPAAPVQKVQKEAVGFPPVVEAAKSGRATCKISQEKIEKDELRVGLCVEINQCVGCTRQFFTKSFLGDGAAVLARSSGEEPASPRRRAGVAATAWGAALPEKPARRHRRKKITITSYRLVPSISSLL